MQISFLTRAYSRHFGAGPSPPRRQTKLLEYVGKAVDVLRKQNAIICATHPNANIYTMLSSLVEFDGFYLESDPCLVCNNPEVPFAVSRTSPNSA